MQGHSAPLGIIFYHYKDERPTECENILPFPKSYDKYAFIAFHGSWNRDIPTGYKVVYVPFNSEGDPIGQPIDLLAYVPPNAQWEDGFRPVDVDFDTCGRSIVTSDGTDDQGSKVVYIQYVWTDPPGSSRPIAVPTTPPSSASSIPTCDCTPTAMTTSSPSSSESVMNRWNVLLGLILALIMITPSTNG